MLFLSLLLLLIEARQDGQPRSRERPRHRGGVRRRYVSGGQTYNNKTTNTYRILCLVISILRFKHCIHVYVYAHVRVYVCNYMYIYIYIRVYIYIYIL